MMREDFVINSQLYIISCKHNLPYSKPQTNQTPLPLAPWGYCFTIHNYILEQPFNASGMYIYQRLKVFVNP